MSDKKDNRWFAGFDRWLDKQAQKRIDRYIDRYAKKEDGTTDEALARRIGWEVGRRAETGKQLDIYEPLRWTGIRTVLGLFGAAAAKMIEAHSKNKTDKKYFQFMEVGIVAGTLINSAIDLARLLPRWLAGLEGGKNTALKLHRQFEPPPNDQAFSPPPLPKNTQADSGHSAVTANKANRLPLQRIGKNQPIQPTTLIQQTMREDAAGEKSL